MRIGGKGDKRQVSDKARAAGNAYGRGRRHGVAHNALQDASRKRKADTDKPADEHAWEAEIPDEQARRASVIDEERLCNVGYRDLNAPDAGAHEHRKHRKHTEYGNYDDPRCFSPFGRPVRRRIYCRRRPANDFFLHAFFMNSATAARAPSSSSALGWPRDCFCFSKRSIERCPFCPSGMRVRAKVRRRSMLPRQR